MSTYCRGAHSQSSRHSSAAQQPMALLFIMVNLRHVQISGRIHISGPDQDSGPGAGTHYSSIYGLTTSRHPIHIPAARSTVRSCALAHAGATHQVASPCGCAVTTGYSYLALVDGGWMLLNCASLLGRIGRTANVDAADLCSPIYKCCLLDEPKRDEI
jgi:hypothetical protein